MLDTSINIKTDSFDGPLALLLMLIQKEQMSIKDLDLTLITRQYLIFLQEMRELNFNIAGDYLFLASMLLFLKSKDCISDEEQEQIDDENKALNIMSHADLVKRLEELQKFQRLGQKLWNLNKQGHEVFVKARVDRAAIVNSILSPMDLEKLTTTMMDLFARGKRKYSAVRKDRISIKDKLVILKDHLHLGEKYTFSKIVSDFGGNNIDNIVISFISVLELARLKQLSIFQTDDGGDIYIEVINDFDGFDVDFTSSNLEEKDEDNIYTDGYEPTQVMKMAFVTNDESTIDQIIQQ